MRLVAVADTHLFHDGYEVPDGDVLVHAGDLLRGGTLDELSVAARWLREQPHRHKVIVAGNHDWAFVRAAAQAREVLGDMIYLQDDETTLDGVRFYGSPWQPTFQDWAFNLERGPALAAIWARIPVGIDVLVTHSPPRGIGDRIADTNRAGCEQLRDRVAVVRPRLHLFGHIHQDGGSWTDHGTVFANVTTWECERAPTVIDIDGERVTAIVIPPTGHGK